MRLWYSQDRFKPFYGRRRVRKLCDYIDSLKVMLDKAVRERDMAVKTLRLGSYMEGIALMKVRRSAYIDAIPDILEQPAVLKLAMNQARKKAGLAEGDPFFVRISVIELVDVEEVESVEVKED